MQGEDFGGKENVWEGGHQAQTPVPSGAQAAEGRARLSHGSVGQTRLRSLWGDCPRDVEQGSPQSQRAGSAGSTQVGKPHFAHRLERGPGGSWWPVCSWVVQGAASLRVGLGSFL